MNRCSPQRASARRLRLAMPLIGAVLGGVVRIDPGPTDQPGFGCAWIGRIGIGRVGIGRAWAQSLDTGALEQVFGEPVTSSATGRPQLVSEAPANMDIITQDDIRRSGATSIPDILQFLPGLDVRRYGMGDVDVGIRGYNQPYNPRLLVLVNGREVYEEAYGHVPWEEIPVQLSEIRQIEVIKGPNSALYGFNAVSGVINIITYDPLVDIINAATFSTGTQDYQGGSVVGTAHLADNLGVRLSAGGFTSKDFAPAGMAPIDLVTRRSPEIGAFNVDAKARPASGVETFIEASMTDSRAAEDTFVGVFSEFFTRTNSLRAGMSVDTGIGLLSLSAYRNEELVSVETDLSSLADWVKQDVYVVQASDLMKLGTDNTVRLGLEYRNNAATAPGFLQGTIGYDDYAASAMWNWQILPSLSLTTALRTDTLSLRYSGTPATGPGFPGFSVSDYDHAGFTAVSFNTGLVDEVTPLDTLRLMAARGVQLPSLVDFGQQASFGTLGAAVVTGNPNVQPSIVHNIEMDYDRAVPAWDSTVRTALFVQRSDNIISQPLSSPVQFDQFGVPLLLTSNVGSSSAAGAEIGINGHSASGWRWNASYSFVATSDHTTLNQGPAPTSAIDYARSVPQHVLIGGIGYTWEKLELDAQVRWQSSYQDYRSTGDGFTLQPFTVDNYVTMNGRIGYQVTDHVTVALSAQQFNTSRLYQTAAPPVERRIIASLTVRY
jgi:outer membrane receptor for ferrienterochelin and colicins